jgi:hypothetical protein
MSTSTAIKEHSHKIKRRGFVMTGGGAKGFYEAGVIHALHISGMDFDVITGSSIGAINSVFFAEYLYRKHQLPEEVLKDPLRTIEQMDSLIKAYHHAWLQLPDKKLIDDSEEGPLGKLKNDLERFNLGLPQIIRLGWWWTDPARFNLPPVGVWAGLVGLGKELIERLGGSQELLRILKNNRSSPVREAARTYLARFGMDRSLVAPEDDHKLRDIFTQPISPLQVNHLLSDVSAPDSQETELFILIDPERTLRDYSQKDIAVRLTRANYRTGRLEISAWIDMEEFVRFMQKQAWKLKAFGPDKIPLGSFRLQVPGNPNAINAALCSGRFPGVFVPYQIEDIFPSNDPENLLLAKLLSHWLADEEIETSVSTAYHAINRQASRDDWAKDYNEWKNPTKIGDYFPKTGDTYVDGGAIDNTPTSSAVDYIREWMERNKLSRREVVLDLLVTFLDTEPKVDPDKANAPTIFEVVTRTLAIQGAAKKTSDANTVGAFNAFGQRGEELGIVIQALLESYRETLGSLDPSKARQAQERLRERVSALLIRNLSGKIDQASSDMILDQIDQWSENVVSANMPMRVNVIKVYPEKMPLGTLQFTERLGYRKENAIQMLTMGCYDTLNALRRHLEGQNLQDLDAKDQMTLALVRKWMGDQAWPESISEQEKLCHEFRCQRTACVFQSGFCAHAASQQNA